MTIFRADHNEVRGPRGVISDVVVQTDVTAPVTRFDIHTKARQALNVNASYLALATPSNAQVAAQVGRLTRENSAIIRLLLSLDGAADLLVENTDT